MDLKVENLLRDYLKDDNSFKDKDSGLSILFGTNKYTKVDMRETWELGIKHGIEIGLFNASIEGQRLEMYHNISDPRHKDFLNDFYDLCNKYRMAIQYNHKDGMTVVDTSHEPVKYISPRPKASMKQLIYDFLYQYGKIINDDEDVDESILNTHYFINWENLFYYIPKKSILYSDIDELIVEFLLKC